MQYRILKKCAVAGRFLDPGNQIDTERMPVYTDEAMKTLVSEGVAEVIQKPAPKTAERNSSRREQSE